MNLQKQYPKAWADFEKWYDTPFWKITLSDFLKLPFEMQLGVYLKYLWEKDIDIMIEVGETDVMGNGGDSFSGENHMQEGVEQAFKVREEQLK